MINFDKSHVNGKLRGEAYINLYDRLNYRKFKYSFTSTFFHDNSYMRFKKFIRGNVKFHYFLRFNESFPGYYYMVR